MNDKPKTKKECFAQLDEMVSDADKQAIMKTKDLIEFHFSLGMWIRNNWIYPFSDEEVKAFMNLFEDEDDMGFRISHPDFDSSVIIDDYVEYLKNKN